MAWNNHIVQAARPHFAICFMTHSGKPDNSECEANARLIAAAPDLLAACEGVMLAYQQNGIYGLAGPTLSHVKEAIAKARGT